MIDNNNNDQLPLLAGKTVYVAVLGLDMAPALITGLESAGATVVVVGDNSLETFSSRESVNAAFAKATSEFGMPDVVVHAAAAPAAIVGGKLVDLSVAAFEATADVSLRATLYTLQACHALMQGKGGSVVVLGPAMSLVGAGDLVPLITASEGQRSLVKAAARQWGAVGIRLNWVGLADSQFAPALAGRAPQVPELGPPASALGRVPELATDVAAVIAFLGSRVAAAVTGATLNLDGGEWMTP